MARIPDTELERLKEEVSVERLVEAPPRQNTCRFHRTRLFLTSCS